MKKRLFFYAPPKVEVIEVCVESGFAGSGSNPGSGSGTESWEPGDSI